MPDFKVKDLTRRLQLSKKIYEHNFAILIKLGAGSRERHAKKENGLISFSEPFQLFTAAYTQGCIK